MAKEKGTRIKILKGERIMYILLFLVIVFSPILVVFSKATLSKTNIEVSRLALKINTQKGVNESLNMKINELASLDKIQALAKELGLSYNNNNIKVITDN